MFKINERQLIALSNEGREAFIKSIAELLREEDDDIKNIPHQELQDQILMLIQKANRYHFTLNTTIASFIITGFAMGENFDADFKAAKEILTRTDYDEEKMAEELRLWVVEIFSAFENN